MKKLIILFVCVFLMFSSSCSKLTLSEEEAKTIVSEYLKLPKPKACILTVNENNHPEFREGLLRLESKGYIRQNSLYKGTRYTPHYIPTAIGSDNIQKISYNPTNQTYSFKGTVCNLVIGKINEILIDSKMQMARIELTLDCIPVEPFYSSLCVDNICNKCDKKQDARVKLRKYDKGWAQY